VTGALTDREIKRAAFFKVVGEAADALEALSAAMDDVLVADPTTERDLGERDEPEAAA
jgi:hypothetical protein